MEAAKKGGTQVICSCADHDEGRAERQWETIGWRRVKPVRAVYVEAKAEPGVASGRCQGIDCGVFQQKENVGAKKQNIIIQVIPANTSRGKKSVLSSGRCPSLAQQSIAASMRPKRFNPRRQNEPVRNSDLDRTSLIYIIFYHYS